MQTDLFNNHTVHTQASQLQQTDCLAARFLSQLCVTALEKNQVRRCHYDITESFSSILLNGEHISVLVSQLTHQHDANEE